MTSLDQVLRTSVSSLGANQSALNTTANNIANVNTPGYVRRTANFETQVLADQPVGVKVAGATRAVNEFMIKEERLVIAQQKRFELMDELHRQFQSLLGAPGDDLTFTGRLDKAFAAIANLASNPDSQINRLVATNQITDYATEINRISKLLMDLRNDADSRLQQAVSVVNQRINLVQEINPKIVRQLALGADVTTLTEQRDISVRKLAEFIDISTFDMTGGALGLSTTNGVVLLDSLKRELQYEPPGVVTTQTKFDQVTVNKILPNGTKESVGVLDPDVSSGSIFGLLEMRDVQLPNMLLALGEISGAVIDKWNGVHNNNSTVPPPANLVGRNVGVLGTDNHNFTGSVTLATIRANNDIDNRVTIDFTNGTTALNAAGATAIGGTTITHVVNAVNAKFGGTALTLAGGQLRFARVGGSAAGVAVLQDTTSPSSRGGRGFAHFFGLNDLAQAEAPGHFETGFAGADAHGFGNTGAVEIDLRGPRGQTSESFTLNFATAGATSMADVLGVLNAGFTGKATFSLSSSGELLAVPVEAFSDHHFSVTTDSTARGVTTKTFSDVFGLGRHHRMDRALKVGLRSDIASNPNNLALAQLDLGAAAIARTTPGLTVGDNRGVTALQNVTTSRFTFAAAGDLVTTTKTLSDYAGLVLSDMALKGDEVESRRNDAIALEDELTARIKNEAGVNIDEELANMILFQNAFNASARLIATTRQMFEELLSIGR